MWYEGNLTWLFIQIVLPALIATALPGEDLSQRDPRSHVEGGAECLDQSDLCLGCRVEAKAKPEQCRAGTAMQVYQDYCYLIKLYSHC